MRRFFRRREPHPHSERKHHLPVFAVILMGIGLITVLYFLIVYLLIPFLAMLTPV